MRWLRWLRAAAPAALAAMAAPAASPAFNILFIGLLGTHTAYSTSNWSSGCAGCVGCAQLHQLRWLRLLRHLRSIYCSLGFWGPILPIVLRIGALAELPEIGPAARSCVDGTDARSCVFKTVTFTVPIVSVGASISLMAHVTWSGVISHSYDIDARNRVHYAWRATYKYRRVQRKTSPVSISSIFCLVAAHGRVNTLRPRQNGNHFPDDVLKCFFLNENVWISNKISLNVVPNCAQLTKCPHWLR